MIEVKNVRKRYRWRSVLNDISFTADKGQITCLVGVNGAGKSTIMKAIMGLTPINGGTIRIDGQPLDKEIYKKVTFIPDHLTMPPGMKFSDAFQFTADFYPNWNPGKARELLNFFRLDETMKIGTISKGMAAKFNLTLGLALDSDYVLMDEPFSGIDVFSREQIAEVFTSELIEDKGVLLTTHEIGEMEHLIDKAVLLKNGSVYREIDCEQMRGEENKSIIDVMREVYQA